jgi:hypothetical protein
VQRSSASSIASCVLSATRHTRVDGVPPVSDTFLPFLVQEVAGGTSRSCRSQRSRSTPSRPFLTADRRASSSGNWLPRAKARATQGSPTMQAREAERLLRDLGDSGVRS